MIDKVRRFMILVLQVFLLCGCDRLFESALEKGPATPCHPQGISIRKQPDGSILVIASGGTVDGVHHFKLIVKNRTADTITLGLVDYMANYGHTQSLGSYEVSIRLELPDSVKTILIEDPGAEPIMKTIPR